MTGWPVVGLAFVSLLSVLVVQVFQYLTARDASKRLVTVEKKVEDTHTLVNSAHGVELELIVTQLEELYHLKPKDVSVKARLEAANKALNAHKTKQAVVDDRAAQR